MEGELLIFYDGTFFVVPKLFKQLFSISFKADGHHFVTFHILMTGKSTAHYVAVFNFLKNLMPNWNPQSAMADFEDASRLALLQIFPNILGL